MYCLYYFRKRTNLRLRKHLIQMLLFPVIDYCCLVYNNLSNDVNSRLQKLVNSGIRYIYSLKWWEHITPYRRELGWLTTTARAKYFAANLLRKIFNTATPFYLLAFLLSQRESFVTVKIFESKILINFDVFEHPESE